MNFRHFRLCVLVGFLLSVSSYAGATELVENMPIKSIEAESTTVEADEQSDVRISKVLKKEISLGHPIIIEFREPFVRTSIANPEVVDTLALSSRQVIVTGKSPGNTSLSVWDKSKHISHVIELIVQVSTGALQHTLSALFPEEKDYVVTAAHEHIVLTGQVANAEMKDKFGQVAKAYAHEKVLNFLKYLKE